MKEAWKKVRGWPQYQVSSMGRVRRGTRILNPAPNSWGYLLVQLKDKPRKSSTRFVHRLVLEAFVRKRLLHEEAAHLNGDKLDNRLSNLKWVTRLENERHKVAHGTIMRGERHHQAKLTEEDVRRIRVAHADGTSSRELAMNYNVAPSTIDRIVHRARWKHVS